MHGDFASRSAAFGKVSRGSGRGREATSAMNEPSGIAARTVAAAAASAKRGLELLLYGLQSPINIGMILRVAETYQFRVSIYDRHRVLEDAVKFGTIKD